MLFPETSNYLSNYAESRNTSGMSATFIRADVKGAEMICFWRISFPSNCKNNLFYSTANGENINIDADGVVCNKMQQCIVCAQAPEIQSFFRTVILRPPICSSAECARFSDIFIPLVFSSFSIIAHRIR